MAKMSDFHVVGDPRFAPDVPSGGGGVSQEYVDNADINVKKTAAQGHSNKYNESVLPSIFRNKLYVYGNPELMYKASETGGDEPIYAIGGSEVSYNWWGQEVETWDKADYKIYGEDTDSGNNYNRLAIVKCVNPENTASSYYVCICPDYKYTVTANPQAANAAISVINSLSHEYGATPKTRLWRQVYSGEPLTPQGYVDIDYANQIAGVEIYDESTYNKYYNCRIAGIPLFNVTSNTQEAFDAVNTYIATGDASGAINYEDINPGSKNSYCAIDVISGDWYSIVNNAWVKQGTLDLNETGVEANPQGTPTDTLNSIEIDGVIYSVEGGSPTPTENIKYTIVTSSTGDYDAAVTINKYIDDTLDTTETILFSDILGIWKDYDYFKIGYNVINTPCWSVQVLHDIEEYSDGYTDTWHYTNTKNITLTVDSGDVALSDLSDVELTNLSNGQILQYNSTTEKWENADNQDSVSAEDVTYDNTQSDLTADNTQDAIDELADKKADKSTSLSGYGITDAYTKSETDTLLNAKANTADLGTASAKNFTTSVTQGSNDLVTSGAVWTAIDNLPEPMVFKGTLGTNGTITSLPTASSSNEGWTYKVITAGTYAGQSAKIGDLFTSNATEWVYIPSGDETDTDTWRGINVNGSQLLGNGISSGNVNFKGGTNAQVSGSGNDITVDVDTTFTDASSRVNIASGDSIKTILGKIKKWFSDLKALAFIDTDGSSSTKYLRGDGTWQALPNVPTNAYQSSDTTESTLADDDKIPFYDDSASGRRNSTWANIKAKLKSYFDTLYSTTDEKVTPVTTNPSSATTYNIPFISGTSNQQPKTNDGITYRTREGTTSARGMGFLQLGNTTKSGVDGNKYGELRLFSEENYLGSLNALGITANREWNLPDKNGTIATTDDIKDEHVKQTPTTTNATYKVLFSGTADNAEHTEIARKCDGVTINPYSGAFNASWVNGTQQSTTISNKAYVTNDTHILKLGYFDCNGNYDQCTLLISSAFWGNQHGSTDIITFRQSNNVNSGSAAIKKTVRRISLESNRTFYAIDDNTNQRVYLYVYVTGGNSYGIWRVTALQQFNTQFHVEGAWNQSITTSGNKVSVGGNVNVAEQLSSYGSIASGDTKAVTGGTIYNYHNVASLQISTNCYAEKSGNVVNLQCRGDTLNTISAIPSGYRPKRAIEIAATITDSNSYCYSGYLFINTDGSIHGGYFRDGSMANYIGGTDNTYKFYFNTTYIV